MYVILTSLCEAKRRNRRFLIILSYYRQSDTLCNALISIPKCACACVYVCARILGMSAISANGSLSNSTFTTQRARVCKARSCLFS
nr:MAG TPA: hypothetical protein [Microviridae sp.]